MVLNFYYNNHIYNINIILVNAYRYRVQLMIPIKKNKEASIVNYRIYNKNNRLVFKNDKKEKCEPD